MLGKLFFLSRFSLCILVEFWELLDDVVSFCGKYRTPMFLTLDFEKHGKYLALQKNVVYINSGAEIHQNVNDKQHH